MNSTDAAGDEASDYDQSADANSAAYTPALSEPRKRSKVPLNSALKKRAEVAVSEKITETTAGTAGENKSKSKSKFKSKSKSKSKSNVIEAPEHKRTRQTRKDVSDEQDVQPNDKDDDYDRVCTIATYDYTSGSDRDSILLGCRTLLLTAI